MRNARNVRDKSRADKGDGSEDKQREKKFDKKKYRLQKYSNKYKGMYIRCIYATDRLSSQFYSTLASLPSVNQWEERRKKAVLRGFYKELEKDRQNSAGTSSSSSDASQNANETRYVLSAWNRFGIYDLKSNVDRFVRVCEQQVAEEGLCLLQGQAGIPAEAGREEEEGRGRRSHKSGA